MVLTLTLTLPPKGFFFFLLGGQIEDKVSHLYPGVRKNLSCF